MCSLSGQPPFQGRLNTSKKFFRQFEQLLYFKGRFTTIFAHALVDAEAYSETTVMNFGNECIRRAYVVSMRTASGRSKTDKRQVSSAVQFLIFYCINFERITGLYRVAVKVAFKQILACCYSSVGFS